MIYMNIFKEIAGRRKKLEDKLFLPATIAATNHANKAGRVAASRHVAKEIGATVKGVKFRFRVGRRDGATRANPTASTWIGTMPVLLHRLGKVTQTRAGVRAHRMDVVPGFAMRPKGMPKAIAVKRLGTKRLPVETIKFDLAPYLEGAHDEWTRAASADFETRVKHEVARRLK